MVFAFHALMKWTLLFFGLFGSSLPLYADVLHLKDGRVLQGVIVEVEGGIITLQQGVDGARIVSTHSREDILMVRLGPVNLDRERDRALRYMREKQYSEALPIWKYIHVLEPENVPYGLGLAKVLLLTGNGDEARSLGERLLSRSPKEGSIHLELGEIALASGEAEEAIHFAKAAGNSGFLLLFRAYSALGKREEANRSLHQAWGNDPGNTQIFIRLWRGLVENRDFSSAEKLSRDWVERKPQERKGWLLLGQVLHAQGEYRKAISMFKKAITLGGPGFDRARVYLRVSEAREKGCSPFSNIQERDINFACELEPELRRNHP